jgi:2-polyprenyl-3-methyl-5-hydroxy-6-metoxy-1,4-benzoquinol methylase
MSLRVQKKLRSGVSVWMAYPRRRPLTRQLERQLETEILVVGAGIGGALIVYSLAREGHRVCGARDGSRVPC